MSFLPTEYVSHLLDIFLICVSYLQSTTFENKNRDVWEYILTIFISANLFLSSGENVSPNTANNLTRWYRRSAVDRDADRVSNKSQTKRRVRDRETDGRHVCASCSNRLGGILHTLDRPVCVSSPARHARLHEPSGVIDRSVDRVDSHPARRTWELGVGRLDWMHDIYGEYIKRLWLLKSALKLITRDRLCALIASSSTTPVNKHWETHWEPHGILVPGYGSMYFSVEPRTNLTKELKKIRLQINLFVSSLIEHLTDSTETFVCLHPNNFPLYKKRKY